MNNISQPTNPLVSAKPFKLKYADYAAMHMAQPRNRLKGWKAHGVLIGAAALNIAISLYFISLEGNLFGYAWISYVNLILGLCILLMSYVLRPIVMRRHYAASGLAEQELEWYAYEDMCLSRREGLESRFAWDKLIGYSETDVRFFLWINKLQAVIVPKHALNGAADFDRIRRLVEDSGVKKFD